MTKEIVTLQLGSYSNYVGTHWWNVQESSFEYKDYDQKLELDHDVLFREGHNSREVTYTPRLVFVDFNENLGSLPCQDTLYNTTSKSPEEEQVFWDNKVEVHRSSPEPLNEFLRDLELEDEQFNSSDQHAQLVNGSSARNGIVNTVTMESPRAKVYYLDQAVRTWADYKRIHFHPRSAVTFNQRCSGSDTFDSWIAGVEHFKSADTASHVEEAVRFYAEESDALQGFHVLCDLNNGFGGFACSLMEYLRDEFPGKSFVVLPSSQLQSSCGLSKARDSSLSSLLTLSGLLDTASVLCPLSLSSDIFQLQPRAFPHLIYDASSPYHTSAILASSLETATRPYRLKSNAFNLANITGSLVSGSRKLVGMTTALPLSFDVNKHESLFDVLLDHETMDSWVPISPNLESPDADAERCYSQAVSLCGLPTGLLLPSKLRTGISDHEFRNPNEMIEKFLSERYPTSTNSVSVLTSPIITTSPFPHIFANTVLDDGFVKPLAASDSGQFPIKSRRNGAGDVGNVNGKVAVNVRSVPMLTNWQSSSSARHLLKRCRKRAAVMKRWVAQDRHSEAAVEQDALEEAVERFRTLEQDYCHLTVDDSSDSD